MRSRLRAWFWGWYCFKAWSNHLQSCLVETMAKVMMKIGTVPGLSMGQSMFPPSLQSSIGGMSETSIPNPVGSITSLTSLKTLEHTAQIQTKMEVRVLCLLTNIIQRKECHRKHPSDVLKRLLAVSCRLQLLGVTRIMNRALAVGKQCSSIGAETPESHR